MNASSEGSHEHALIETDRAAHTNTHMHIDELRHALSSNTPPEAEGRLAHLWLLTPGANHLYHSRRFSLPFYSPGGLPHLVAFRGHKELWRRDHPEV